MFKYFTIKTANEILPLVIAKFEDVKKKKNEVMIAEKELQVILSSTDDFENYIKMKQKLNQTMYEFYKSIDDLESTGVVMKGLDNGLLDFPSQRFEEEVWLCWKEGEKEIKFWHEKDSGFNGRKPIEVNDEPLV